MEFHLQKIISKKVADFIFFFQEQILQGNKLFPSMSTFTIITPCSTKREPFVACFLFEVKLFSPTRYPYAKDSNPPSFFTKKKQNMPVTKIEIVEDAFFVCMTHALTTEKEEVMGLLLGDVRVRLFAFLP